VDRLKVPKRNDIDNMKATMPPRLDEEEDFESLFARYISDFDLD